nr:YfhO family protein [Staphylococcus lugdunensis]
PYRKGMMAYVDGKRINPIRVNTMMTGIPVKKSTTSIIIKYLPPHWIVMLLLSSISILCSIMITRIFTKKRKDEE